MSPKSEKNLSVGDLEDESAEFVRKDDVRTLSTIEEKECRVE